jgi:hypothetical protein
MFRLRLVLVLAILLPSSVGCAYLKNRGNDAKDVVDAGFTFSKRPAIAAYYSFIPLVAIGYGDVQGRFAGVGGGRLAAWAPHRERSCGLILWGREELNFGTPQSELDAMNDADRRKALHFHRPGPIGVIQGPLAGPEYLISCPHYLHLGWFGLVLTPRYLEMADFLLGWTTLDIGGDDNRGAVETAKGK